MATAAATQALEPSAVRFRPSARGWALRLAVLVAIFGGLLLRIATLPGFWNFRIALAAIYAIIGLSLNVVLGYVGQVSLGHHGFVGISAFIAAAYATNGANCTIEGGCSLGAFAAALVIAIAAGALSAGVLGLVALRIKGLYLALITLSFGFMAERTIFEIPSLTRGGAGMPAPRPDGFVSDTAYAFLCIAFLALVLFVDWRLLKTKAGRAVLSIKHSEPVAASYGINVTAYKVLAFALSGAFAGLAGGLFAFHAQNVVSNNFQFQVALLWVLMVLIGGLGNRTGVVIGSVFIALFPSLVELINPLEHFVATTLERPIDYVTLVLGALLALVTLIRFPGGIAEQIWPLTNWLRGNRFALHPEGHQRKAKSPHGIKALLHRLKHRGAS
jgi:branched-chain amino acid transport system permease protein